MPTIRYSFRKPSPSPTALYLALFLIYSSNFPPSRLGIRNRIRLKFNSDTSREISLWINPLSIPGLEPPEPPLSNQTIPGSFIDPGSIVFLRNAPNPRPTTYPEPTSGPLWEPQMSTAGNSKDEIPKLQRDPSSNSLIDSSHPSHHIPFHSIPTTLYHLFYKCRL